MSPPCGGEKAQGCAVFRIQEVSDIARGYAQKPVRGKSEMISSAHLSLDITVRTDTICNGVKNGYTVTMKKLLIKWLLPYVIDMLISALVGMVNRSDNSVDDEIVDVIIANRDKIEDRIRLELL